MKVQDDVDVLILNKTKDKAVFCECKFKNSKFDLQDLNAVLDSMKIFPFLKEKWIYVFSKSGWTSSVEKVAKENNASLITLENLF